MIYDISRQKLKTADNLIIENKAFPTATAKELMLISFERRI